MTDSKRAIPANARGLLRALKIIYAALMLGLVIFGVIVTIVSLGRGPEFEPQEFPKFLPVAAGALTLTTVMPAVVLGGVILRRLAGAPGLPAGERAQRFMGGKILVAAVAEGPGLFWGVITLISGDLINLFGLAFSVFALALLFPREQEWIDVTGLASDGEFDES